MVFLQCGITTSFELTPRQFILTETKYFAGSCGLQEATPFKLAKKGSLAGGGGKLRSESRVRCDF